MSSDRLERSGLNRAWIAAEAARPSGWQLDSLRCASTGLAPEQRSDRWLALAAGPEGETIEGEGGRADHGPERPCAPVGAIARVDERLIVFWATSADTRGRGP